MEEEPLNMEIGMKRERNEEDKVLETIVFDFFSANIKRDPAAI